MDEDGNLVEPVEFSERATDPNLTAVKALPDGSYQHTGLQMAASFLWWISHNFPGFTYAEKKSSLVRPYSLLQFNFKA